MIRGTSEIKLVIKPDPDAYNFNVGFLGFDSCAGNGKRNFNPHISRDTHTLSSSRKVKYQVNLYKRDKK